MPTVATEVRLLRAIEAELAAHVAAREQHYRQVDSGQLTRSLPGLAEIGAPVLVAICLSMATGGLPLDSARVSPAGGGGHARWVPMRVPVGRRTSLRLACWYELVRPALLILNGST